MTKLSVQFTNTFKKDVKQILKRGYQTKKMDDVICLLANGEPLPEKNRDHSLGGQWAGFRECHIEPDWLLIYKVDNDILILTLTRTGTHSDLF